MGRAIHLLGAPRVERDGQPLPAPRGHKVWGLLAYLALCQAPVNRSHLATLLFEDADDPLGALRWNLSQLRRLIGDAGLGGDVLHIPRESTDFVDAAVILGGSWGEALRVPGLGHELLEGMNFPSSPSFEIWLATERRHLQGAAEGILREAALARLAVGAAAEAADLAGRLVRLNPLDENFQALLVRSLAAAGDGVGAARQAAACGDLFRRELGVAPGPALAAAISTVTATPTARPTTGRAAARAQIDAGEAAINAGALEAGLHCLRCAIVEADAIGDNTLRARARLALGGALVHAARGRDEEGATALHEALAVSQSESSPLAAAACRELGYVEFLRSRYERTLVWLRRAQTLAGDDRAEQTRIATVHGSALSDTAHYQEAIAVLRDASAAADSLGEAKQSAYALSMLGRALLLCGDHPGATAALDRSLALAQGIWTALVPWPQSLRAEIDLLHGDIDAAAERLEHAFALGCQLNDPCWEGIAARGLGRVAIARGDAQGATEVLVDAVARGSRLPDAYLWGKGYTLEVLCRLAVEQGLPQAAVWVEELHALAARSGMRELTVRAHLHSAALGHSASGKSARLLAEGIGSPVLLELTEGFARPSDDSLA